MEAYQQDELLDSEKDAKWIEEAEKAVELKNHRKGKQGSDKDKMDPQRPSGFQPPQFSGSFGFSLPFHSCHHHLTSQCHFRGQQAQQSGYLGSIFIVCIWGT